MPLNCFSSCRNRRTDNEQQRNQGDRSAAHLQVVSAHDGYGYGQVTSRRATSARTARAGEVAAGHGGISAGHRVALSRQDSFNREPNDGGHRLSSFGVLPSASSSVSPGQPILPAVSAPASASRSARVTDPITLLPTASTVPSPPPEISPGGPDRPVVDLGIMTITGIRPEDLENGEVQATLQLRATTEPVHLSLPGMDEAVLSLSAPEGGRIDFTCAIARDGLTKELRLSEFKLCPTPETILYLHDPVTLMRDLQGAQASCWTAMFAGLSKRITLKEVRLQKGLDTDYIMINAIVLSCVNLPESLSRMRINTSIQKIIDEGMVPGGTKPPALSPEEQKNFLLQLLNSFAALIENTTRSGEASKVNPDAPRPAGDSTFDVKLNILPGKGLSWRSNPVLHMSDFENKPSDQPMTLQFAGKMHGLAGGENHGAVTLTDLNVRYASSESGDAEQLRLVNGKVEITQSHDQTNNTSLQTTASVDVSNMQMGAGVVRQSGEPGDGEYSSPDITSTGGQIDVTMVDGKTTKFHGAFRQFSAPATIGEWQQPFAIAPGYTTTDINIGINNLKIDFPLQRSDGSSDYMSSRIRGEGMHFKTGSFEFVHTEHPPTSNFVSTI